MTVKIPIRTEYDGKGLKQLKAEIRDSQRLARLSKGLEREITREHREQVKALKDQIGQRRRLNTLTRKLEREQARERTARRQQFQNVAGAAVGAAGLGAAFATEAFQAAAAAERLEKANEALGRRFGVTSKQIVESIREASGETISRMDAMQQANKAMLLGAVQSEDQFAELAKIAVTLGRAVGQDAQKSVEDITTALGRQSDLILDNLGIIVDTEAAYQTYAASVGKAASELSEAEKKQAFINAALEAGRGAVEELGGVTDDTASKVEKLSAKWSDFNVAFGQLIVSIEENSGALDQSAGLLDRLTEGAEAWSGVADNVGLVNRALEIMNRQQSEAEQTTNNWTNQAQILGVSLETPLRFTKDLIFHSEDLGDAMQQAGDEMKAAKAAADDFAGGIEQSTEAVEDNTEALEEAARRMEEVAQIRRDAARELLRIDERAQEETEEAWQDFFADEAQAWADRNDSIHALRRKAGKDLLKIERDLQRDLGKANKDESKKIEQIKSDAAKEEQRNEKRRRIDALSDERLFNFELRNLAAEGQANQIRQALERREIEQQIAREKAAVESEIEAEKQQDEIERVKETAQERRSELVEDAALETQLREERLAEEQAAEELSYRERTEELRKFREDKLAEIQASRNEAIAELSQELTEAGDLTESELRELAQAAGKLGLEAGVAWGEGFREGTEANRAVSRLLGEGADFTSPTRAGAGASTGLGFPGSGTVPGFAHGGRVPGPLGRPRLIMAHGGEELSNPTMPRGGGGATVHVDLRGAQFGSNLSQADLQQFADDIANGIVEQALGAMVN